MAPARAFLWDNWGPKTEWSRIAGNQEERVQTTLNRKQRNGPVGGGECGDQGEVFVFVFVNNGKYYSMLLS